MRSKSWKILKLVLRSALFCVCSMLICSGIYYLVDNMWNGLFAEWFTREYMRQDIQISQGEEGAFGYVYWPDIKALIFWAFYVTVVFWSVIVLAVSHFYAKAKGKKIVTEISEEIQDHMWREENGREVFKKEYAEISVQMSEFRSSMRHHEQILKEETAKKNDMIAYLAHDLKTPLTSVIGYLSLLDETPDMPEKQKARFVGIALDKAQRLEDLINEFFDITRYDLWQTGLEEETIDLSYMLVQMTDEFYPLLNAHGNTIKLQAEENIMIHGDPIKLARVFNNILKNAIAYSYRGTTIEVWAETTQKEVSICFRNKGKTIPAQKLDSIFEKFFRLDEARATDTGGAGLGLAIAKEIVTLHGGSITAKSEKEVICYERGIRNRP